MLKKISSMGSKPMRILVTGYTGQLGHDVVCEGLNKGLEMYGIGSKCLNITDKLAVYDYVKKLKPDAIIHCAAYTAVDKAEDDKDTCWNVNVEGTQYLVQVAKELNVKFMYISTDYVFNGEGDSPFKETDAPNPIGFYGLTKYEGEEVVKRLLDKWFIIRISWVFGNNGTNFIKTMLRLAETHKELNVVGDQIGSPTYTLDLASLLINIIQSDKYGIYHATNEGFCSWAELATEIFNLVNKDTKVNTISTVEYPTKAVRPKNSRLLKQKLVENGFNPLPTWQDAIIRYLKELTYEVK
jgi:dTDP-4-dehydrorhamnose reductase